MDRVQAIYNILSCDSADQYCELALAEEIDTALPHINWRPIEELPEEWKDGRVLLVWEKFTSGGGVAYEAANEGHLFQPISDDNCYPLAITHFCPINNPQQPIKKVKEQYARRIL